MRGRRPGREDEVGLELWWGRQPQGREHLAEFRDKKTADFFELLFLVNIE
jgi:hypothetical protein